MPPVTGAIIPENAPVTASCPTSLRVYSLPPLTASAAFNPVFIAAALAPAAATPTAIEAPPENGAAATAAV